MAKSITLVLILFVALAPAAFADERDVFIGDSGFEDGTCSTGSSGWTCYSDNDCDWIVDLEDFGYSNYDGEHSAYLGGECESIPTEHTRICQYVEIFSVCDMNLIWHWLADVEQGGSLISVTLDGEELFTKTLTHEDDMLGWQTGYAYLELGGYGDLCFEYDRNGAVGDSYFIDGVFTGLAITPTEAVSFSTVKSLY